MKRLSRFHKFVFVLNILAIVFLIVAWFVPHVSSGSFSFLSFIGLAVPALVLTHMLFVLYWLVQRKQKWYASLIALVITYFSLTPFYRWGGTAEPVADGLEVMSYNVRSFNMYDEMPSKTVLADIKAFVKKENPDIICIQEPYYNSSKEFKDFPYRYLEYFHMQGKGLLAIFSKYPILETGLLNFPKTQSNGIFIDVVYKNETTRIYNVHLESLGITPGQGVLTNESTDKLYQQVNRAFQKQMEQAVVINDHIKSSPHRTILCGDFNNGQYSNVYKTIKGNLQDTFLEAGSGYGRTYLFHGLPFRIDFIFADEAFEVKGHTNYDVPYSDHYPVMASFKLRGE